MLEDRLKEIVEECIDINEFDRTPEQQAIVELSKLTESIALVTGA